MQYMTFISSYDMVTLTMLFAISQNKCKYLLYNDQDPDGTFI